MHSRSIVDRPLSKTIGIISFHAASSSPLSAIEHSHETRTDSRMNVLRFIAIVSIVWGHCLFDMEERLFSSPSMMLTQVMMLQTGRFGTIIFFMISGYYLSDKIESYTCATYLKHRFKTIITPWFTFLSALVFFQVLHIFINNPTEINCFKQLCYTIFQLYKGCIFHAAFWFVPVAVFSSLVLIVLKNRVYNIWLGLSLSIITLFYCINLYYGLISVNHTRAFAAYLIFMWAGIQIKHQPDLIRKRLNSVKFSRIIVLLILSFVAACTEGYYLKRSGCGDAFASIRFSNIIASLSLFLLLIKSDRLNWLNYLDPQRTVFGIYLIHCLITTELLPYLEVFENRFIHDLTIGSVIFKKCCNFTVVLVLSYLLVHYFKKLKKKTSLLPSEHHIHPWAA